MLGVNERRQPAGLLRVGDDVQHQRGFAGGFRPENFHHAAARDAADAERQVHRQRAGGNDLDFDLRPRVAQAHDAAFAVTFGDGGNGGFEFPRVRRGGFGLGSGFFSSFGCHKILRWLVLDYQPADGSESGWNSQTPDVTNDRTVIRRSAGVHFRFVQWRGCNFKTTNINLKPNHENSISILCSPVLRRLLAGCCIGKGRSQT